MPLTQRRAPFHAHLMPERYAFRYAYAATLDAAYASTIAISLCYARVSPCLLPLPLAACRRACRVAITMFITSYAAIFYAMFDATLRSRYSLCRGSICCAGADDTRTVRDDDMPRVTRCLLRRAMICGEICAS